TVAVFFHEIPHEVGDFFFPSRRRHTRFDCDWSSDVCSSDLGATLVAARLDRITRRAHTLSGLLEEGLSIRAADMPGADDLMMRRSEERRVGKECRSGGRE